ncbi:MAG: hypothetical protein U5P10_12655 [Spirochaetia bacterium]|nr:hypothetical protein [Spirochaetia bacterium]
MNNEYNRKELTEDFFDDLDAIFIEFLACDNTNYVYEMLLPDIAEGVKNPEKEYGKEWKRDNELHIGEMEYRERELKKLRKDKDLEKFLDALSHIRNSMSSLIDLEEMEYELKTDLAKRLFYADE